MSVKIFDVDKNSKCFKKGVRSGFELISINDNEINDVLDYRFYCEDDKLKLIFLSNDGKIIRVVIRNNSGCDNLGLYFETYLMDKHRHCKNSCIFCFIDQMPQGMRKSLYFKDDDSRLSFLFGNYITLTNLSEKDVDRIIKMHISPINVSIHTMNPQLRVKMMKNPFAGQSLEFLKRFSDAGISINAQLVLCPGINDGNELLYSLNELAKLNTVNSIAAVPVGLTKHREGLFKLTSFNKKSAEDVIKIIDDFNLELEEQGREKIAYPSDEFFQISEKQMPPYEYYNDFPQLDNGVGLYVSTEFEFNCILNEASPDNRKRKFSIATGSAAYPLISKLVNEFKNKYPNTHSHVYEIKNRFFGETCTVAGLITGKDLIDNLIENDFCDDILILPSVMFKSESELIFLDDISVEEIEAKLNTKVIITNTDGESLFNTLFSVK